MRLRSLTSPFFALALALSAFVACGGATTAPTITGSTDDAGAAGVDASSGDDAAPGDDASSPAADASPTSDAGTGIDGTPTRKMCTAALGNALTTSFGRLDGFLVAIVPVGQRSCNGDSTHVHLQVAAMNATYDVAVNVDGLFHQQDVALAAGWTEGWHTGIANSYSTLGAHSSAFMPTNVAALAMTVESALANANHVSVFATGYGPDGVHLVHYKGRSSDGMVVIDPLGPTPHALMFAFQGDTF